MHGAEKLEASDRMELINTDENEYNVNSKSTKREHEDEAQAVLRAIDDAAAFGRDNDHENEFFGEREDPEVIEYSEICGRYRNNLVALAVTSVSAVVLVYFFPKNEILYRLFPFYACLISFIGGFVSGKNAALLKYFIYSLT